MNQKQSIGSNNQQQGLPDERNQQTKSPDLNLKQAEGQPEKPAVTDDKGNVVDKHFKEAGKGYSENKPTEPWSNVKPQDNTYSDKSPDQQSADQQKSYGKNTNPRHENLKDHHDFPQQANQEEKDAYEKRVRQSGNVPG